MTKGIDASDESSYLAPPSKEKPLVPIPVAGGSSGEGFPYAPVGWPCPGDVWRWKVGNRKTPSGYWIDRHLYPPIRYQKATGNKIKFSSRVSIREYIQKEYPDADINAFFSSFIWKIPCAGLIPRKDANNYNFSYTFPRSSDVNGHSASESKTKVGDCKIGNKMCSLQVKARSYVLAAKDCDICCSEADFCRDCCCILCCRTIGWEYGGYSFIRCEATVDENYICGHVAHVDCALRAYMAGTVGGTIDLDVEYCCRRCDNKTDLIPHVSKLIRNCESLDAPNDILKILDLCLCILHGSNQMRASNLRNHIGCVMDKLKHGVRLDEIWEVEDNISTLTTAPSGSYLAMRTPSPSTNKSLDVHIPPLPRDLPLSSRAKWMAKNTNSVRYVMGTMITDLAATEEEKQQFFLTQQQFQHERDSFNAQLEAIKNERDALATHIEQVGQERDRAKAGLAKKDTEFQSYKVDLEKRMTQLMELYESEAAEKCALLAEKNALLAAVSNPPGSTDS